MKINETQGGIGITGALIIAAAILLGGGLGLLFKGKIPERAAVNIPRAIGLCVCLIGVSGALEGDIMLLVVSLALGSFAGELMDIDGALNRLGLFIQSKLSRSEAHSTFAEGFTTATLLFCVGAMAVVGSVDSGLRGNHSVIITKSVLDGVNAMIFASTLGCGVLFSAAAILIYQGSIEFFAGYLQPILTDGLVTQVSAAGSLMILGIGINMTAGAGLKVANLLPGLLIAMGYYEIFLT